MKTLYFASSNREKVLIAQAVCSKAGIKLIPVNLGVDEIQGEDPEVIVRDKLNKAYQKLGKPVVVSDDSWNIRALNGFPGPYMKSINHWFSPDDFMRLMAGVDDRRITLHQFLAYTDGKITKVFTKDIHGEITYKPRGINARSPIMSVVELVSDGGKTIAEIFEMDDADIMKRRQNRPDAWSLLVDWYLEQ